MRDEFYKKLTEVIKECEARPYESTTPIDLGSGWGERMTFEEFKKQWEAKGIDVFVQCVKSVHDDRMVGHEYWFLNDIGITIFYNGCFSWSREDAEREAMRCVGNPYYMDELMKHARTEQRKP